MAGSALVKLACAVLACMVIVAPYVKATQLSEADEKFLNLLCLPLTALFELAYGFSTFLRKEPPSESCCLLFKLVEAVEHFTGKMGRQADCSCFKDIAESKFLLNPGYAEQLPAKCNATLPCAFASGVNCTRVM